ncbi:YdcH family protein [Marinivivus vitaminiproducens]|uniref:YdcH family protein n=1 Tax=Marinivivus vitaminiproducens TaxID=3035935 RepID=UPI00279DDE82|nr:DUF465 domain-containing protein [Geminicoccaceae bacterium SCSIO 64248]
MNEPNDRAALERKLSELQAAHRALDNQIVQMMGSGAYDMLEVQRLKKMKLRLKDRISALNDVLLPDIIA